MAQFADRGMGKGAVPILGAVRLNRALGGGILSLPQQNFKIMQRFYMLTYLTLSFVG